MKDENGKYLDPDKSPLESEGPDDKLLDPDQSPLESEAAFGADGDAFPLDGSDPLVDLYRSAFGSVENVQIDDIQLRRLGESVELFDGEWKKVPEEKLATVRQAIEDFKEKSRG